MKRCIIFGGAELSSYDFIKLYDDDFIICADRGYQHCINLNRKPDVVLGDMDSFYGELSADIEFFKYNSEKDETDLEIAINLAVDRGYKDLTIVGAIGGRFDHTIGNICLLKRCIDIGVNAVIKDSRTEVRLLKENYEFRGENNFYYSLFPIFDDALVSLQGFKYNLEEKLLHKGDVVGISNEAAMDKCKIIVKQGSVLFIKALKD